jgi:hypothetical protein
LNVNVVSSTPLTSRRTPPVVDGGAAAVCAAPAPALAVLLGSIGL